MAISLYAHGTQAAVIATEHLLTDVVMPGTYSLSIDLSAMAAADAVQVRVYSKVLAGGASRVVSMTEFLDAQSADARIHISIPISNVLLEENSVRFTLRQTAGGVRSFPWAVIRHA